MAIFIHKDKLFKCKKCLTYKKTELFQYYRQRNRLFYKETCKECHNKQIGLTKIRVIPDLPFEVWDVVMDKHYISNFGRVKTKTKYKDILISTPISNIGYRVFSSFDNGKRKTVTLHRVIAKAFIPNPLNLPCVNHIDGNKLNNSLSNLEWCTYKRNNAHAKELGLWHSPKGEKIGSSKLKNTQVLDIFNSKKKGTVLSKEYGVSIWAIYDIKNGKSWCHITKNTNNAINNKKETM